MTKKVFKKQIKIIHFEDEPFIGELYKIKLEENNFNAVHYLNPPKTADELVQLVIDENPDLIITDIIHSYIDGFKMIKILKNDKRTKKIPICVFTNMGGLEDIQRGLKLGAEKYLINSQLTPEELIKEIRELLGLPIPPKKKPKAPEPNFHRPSFFDLPLDDDKNKDY